MDSDLKNEKATQDLLETKVLNILQWQVKLISTNRAAFQLLKVDIQSSNYPVIKNRPYIYNC